MVSLIMLLFGLSTAGQYHLEMPEFLPFPRILFVRKRMNLILIQTVDMQIMLFFGSWCLGNRCDDHAVKGYAKEIAEDGTITWYSTQEQVDLDIDF